MGESLALFECRKLIWHYRAIRCSTWVMSWSFGPLISLAGDSSVAVGAPECVHQ